MNVQWWAIADGEWEGLDNRYVHCHFWIGKFTDLHVLELTNPNYSEDGIVLAAKYSLSEAQAAAEDFASLMGVHLAAKDIRDGILP